MMIDYNIHKVRFLYFFIARTDAGKCPPKTAEGLIVWSRSHLTEIEVYYRRNVKVFKR